MRVFLLLRCIFVVNLIERNINGQTLCLMSREDIAVIFPSCDKFILGMNLYRFIQEQRGSISETSTDTSNSCGSESTSVASSLKKRSAPSATGPPFKQVSADRNASTVVSEFKLPLFSLDVDNAIKKDQFYTSAKRNKLIREACRALKGYCRSLGKSASVKEKRNLGKTLYSLAPKSLGDPKDIGVDGCPEVRTYIIYIIM